MSDPFYTGPFQPVAIESEPKYIDKFVFVDGAGLQVLVEITCTDIPLSISRPVQTLRKKQEIMALINRTEANER